MQSGIGPGQSLAQGRYVIEELIGEGGMAAVHRARDTALERSVAVKTMNASVAADAGSRERFRREAKAVAAISHAGVVAVHDVGEEELPSGRVPYIVMEYVEGRTLGHWVPARPGGLPLPDALGLVSEVLAALAASHARGMVHRDIKPANVMVGHDGSVKVMDLGIARALDQQATALTGTGYTVGTPHYMSPEQFEPGRPVDGRSDLYAVGVVLFQLLTGALPFDAESGFRIGYQHVTVRPPSLAASGAHQPPEVEALVARALAKDPDARFPDAEAMRAEVERIRVRAVTGSGGSGRAEPAHEPAHVRTRVDRAAAAGLALHGAPTGSAPPPAPVAPGALESLRGLRGRPGLRAGGYAATVIAAGILAVLALYQDASTLQRWISLGACALGCRLVAKAGTPWTGARRDPAARLTAAAAFTGLLTSASLGLAVLMKLVMG
ncbi:protein kinase [Streptomyces sp. NBC_00536]|uniref:protein kinase domain-containing protein n=1 Tax=Streptomyces sp. NBC_00536 TaxID=2975769 RepID=UPI002E81C734|nr:protein kinase [Streptomyces sp. NBC_00536]WUC83000.1 protein kinase [Streptomyces sp. NBC_00536]